ncbi:MAG TPA: NRDE family protein [Saprospiraceae bacterium]|nr:NRDE family protein [Saprospiraceae bacterium]
MCTVTYIPFQGIRFLTSNRDESPSRQSQGLISTHQPDQHSIYFPLDKDSGGSWIALSETGRAVCLLNGGYESFIPNPPYRMSRGQVVMDAVKAEDAFVYVETYDFTGIAPFTLLINEKDAFAELVWDGDEKHIRSLPTDKPQIWSSTTLYPPDVRAWRKSLFEKWISEKEFFESESIIQFHKMANGDQEYGFVMNRNEVVRTLSITNIAVDDIKGSMVHVRLDKDMREEIQIHIE